MTYLSDAMPVTYMSDGVMLPGETVHAAMGANTAHSLAAHLLRPGHGFEHQPVNAAERAAQHTAQAAAHDGPDAPDGDQDGDPAPATYDHAAVATNIRSALRPGAGV